MTAAQHGPWALFWLPQALRADYKPLACLPLLQPYCFSLSTTWFSGLRKPALLWWRTCGLLFEDHKSWHVTWSTHVYFSSTCTVPHVMLKLWNNYCLFIFFFFGRHIRRQAVQRLQLLCIACGRAESFFAILMCRNMVCFLKTIFAFFYLLHFVFLQANRSWSGSKSWRNNHFICSLQAVEFKLQAINLSTGAVLLDLDF